MIGSITRTRRHSRAAAAVLTAGLLAGCGGGSGSGASSPVIVPATAPSAAATSAAATQVPNVVSVAGNGRTQKATIRFQLPQRPHASSSTARRTTARVRTMADTSPTAAVRAAAAQLAAGRKPAYVSSSTENAEFVVTGGTPLATIDETAQTCTQGQGGGGYCSAVFDAPIGTGYSMTLYLYDYNYQLLSVGTLSNVTIVEGTANSLSFTLNGVVAAIQLSDDLPKDPTTGNEVLVGGDTLGETTYNVWVSALLDADDNTINYAASVPGTVIDYTLAPIQSIALNYTDQTLGVIAVRRAGPTVAAAQRLGHRTASVQRSTRGTMFPNPVPITVSGVDPYTIFADVNGFSWDGDPPSDVTEVDITATALTSGTPIVPDSATYPISNYGQANPATGYLYFYPQSASLNLEFLAVGDGVEPFVPDLYPFNPVLDTVMPIVTQGRFTTHSLELPYAVNNSDANTSTVYLQLTENVPYADGYKSFTATDNGNCISPLNGTLDGYQINDVAGTIGVLELDLDTNGPVPDPPCTVTVSDDQGLSTSVTIYVNQLNLTIQKHARVTTGNRTPKGVRRATR